MSHPGLHTRNIFANPEDPWKITDIIDWESAAVEPAFVFAAESPDFAAELPDDPALRQLVDCGEGQDVAYARLRTDVDFCVKTWSLVPMICEKLREASQIDASVVQLPAAPSNGWLADENFLRQVFSEIARNWKDLGYPGRSDDRETPADAEALRVWLDKTRAAQRLREHNSQRLGCDSDGWVPIERWVDVL